MTTQMTYHVVNNNEEVCGHKHRSYEAAEKCMDKLMCWSRDKKNCSAKWYNSKIVPTADGYHYCLCLKNC